jgi:hypothetical protein
MSNTLVNIGMFGETKVLRVFAARELEEASG